MKRAPLFELVLDKMEEKIPMVLCNNQAEQELMELGKMLQNATDITMSAMIQIIRRLREMKQKLSGTGDERKAREFLNRLESSFLNFKINPPA